MVAALAAVALMLLARAEAGRVQVAASVQALQLELYLDAYEILARHLIDTDSGGVDHSAEIWARSDNELEIDRGRVAGQITDMQGRFNLNWLANPEDRIAQDAFDRLLAGLGVAPRTGQLIRTALLPGGASGPGSQLNPSVLEDMPGGPALLLDQLPIPERDRRRLAPYIAVLPGDSRINVNTVAAPVMAAFLPGASQSALDAVLSVRKQEPFVALDVFVTRVLQQMGAEMAAQIDEGRFGTGSDWFEVEVVAELDGQQARRNFLLRRFALPAGAKVAYRLDRW
jgi:general secretion pathway protein K